jgi:hypothetical protein
MAFTVVSTVEDIDTPADTVVVANAADGTIDITADTEEINVDGAAFKLAVQEVNGSSALYNRCVKVYETVEPAVLFVQVEPGTGGGILVTIDATARRVLYAQLLDAVENALNG